MWDNLNGQDIITIEFYAQDTKGNIGLEKVSVIKVVSKDNSLPREVIKQSDGMDEKELKQIGYELIIILSLISIIVLIIILRWRKIF